MKTEYIDTKTLDNKTILKDDLVIGKNTRIIKGKDGIRVVRSLKNPNDIYKLDYLNQIGLPNEIVKATKIIKLDNGLTCYERPFIEGFKAHSIPKDKYTKVLKAISNKLKELNKFGLIYPDIYNNIIVEKNGNIHFINYEELTDSNKIDTTDNEYIKKHNGTNNLDKIYNAYLINKLTISLLGNIYYYFLDYDNVKKNISANDDEIDKIIYKTLNLEKLKEDEIIIDKASKLQKKLKINY